MKQLISATLSEEAASIYNSWQKQKKSARLSEMIVRENKRMALIEALELRRTFLYDLLGQALIVIWMKDRSNPLVKKINSALEGTIHHQYGWED